MAGNLGKLTASPIGSEWYETISSLVVIPFKRGLYGLWRWLGIWILRMRQTIQILEEGSIGFAYNICECNVLWKM